MCRGLKAGQGEQGGSLGRCFVRSEGGLSPRWGVGGGGMQGTDSREYKSMQIEFLDCDWLAIQLRFGRRSFLGVYGWCHY